MYYSSAAESIVTSYYIGWAIGSIIWGIIWGFATNAIIHNKGYDENWFWWGFFFGIFALIVALTKPEYKGNSDSASYTSRSSDSTTAAFQVSSFRPTLKEQRESAEMEKM